MQKSVLLLYAVALAATACAHTPPRVAATPARPGAAGAAAAGDSGRALAVADAATSLKPYATVIPPKARTRRGLFITHRVGDKLYFEIPARELNRDLLLVGRYARAAAGQATILGGYGGDQFDERTLRWERSGDRVILRAPSFTVTADTGLAVYRAVQASAYAPIIATFDVAAYGPDSAAVVDVTRLYTSDVPEFTALKQVDASRSYLENAVAFPDNVEVEATQTGPVTGNTPGSQSVLAHWSMVRLPDRPMPVRRFDERVGFFSIDQLDFGASAQRATKREYITRWRLEKKDPNAAVSDPVRPLVYYVDPATPDVWKPWIRKAILDWRPAFEAAGFSNAIVAADAPSAVEDPDWSPDDVRHTVIRWLPSEFGNATGPHVSDPRTGEILNGSLRIYQNVLTTMRDMYFTQVGPLDARAQHWPMPDSLTGRLLEYVVAHEIGHTLGLRHDMIGSSTYPADSLRSPTWVHRMGHAPSIMDYARFDYVAQPEDHLAAADLVQRVGPYDLFAIHWGYAPVPGAQTPEAERQTLDRWVRVQDTVPWLRFAEDNRAGEYGTRNEAVGDADPVWSTRQGIKNLKRVVGLIPGVALRPGEDNADLLEIYGATVGQWTTEMGHVATVIGGATIQLKSGGQPGPVYTPLGRARQAQAVAFLNEQFFHVPTWLINDSLTRRLQPNRLTMIGRAQSAMLRSLLDNGRLALLIDYAAAPSSRRDSYALTDYLRDLQRGIWDELPAARVVIDPSRRALQAAYLTLLDEKINATPGAPAPNTATPADARAALSGGLDVLRGEIRAGVPRASDLATRLHLQASAVQIDNILRPKA